MSQNSIYIASRDSPLTCISDQYIPISGTSMITSNNLISLSCTVIFLYLLSYITCR